MEDLDNYSQMGGSLVITNEIRDYLYETSKWGKFLAILGYIGLGLLILIAIGMMLGGAMISQFSQTKFPVGIMGGVYIVMAIVYYFPVSFLHKFSNRIRQGLDLNNMTDITYGFKNLKSLYKFTGIATIVVLSLYIVIFIVGIIAAAMMATHS